MTNGLKLYLPDPSKLLNAQSIIMLICLVFVKIIIRYIILDLTQRHKDTKKLNLKRVHCYRELV